MQHGSKKILNYGRNLIPNPDTGVVEVFVEYIWESPIRFLWDGKNGKKCAQKVSSPQVRTENDASQRRQVFGRQGGGPTPFVEFIQCNAPYFVTSPPASIPYPPPTTGWDHTL